MYFLLIRSKGSVLLACSVRNKRATSQVPFLEYVTKGIKCTLQGQGKRNTGSSSHLGAANAHDKTKPLHGTLHDL